MTKEITVQDDFNQALVDIDTMQNMCAKLMKTPHYAKMGQEGIFAIMAKARSMNVNPLDALNGGMYFVKGKVEMSGQMMLSLIRKSGHSVTLDPKSTKTHVIMHGKRVDNGDTWTTSFSVDDARKAGIYSDAGVWAKYPQVMCCWRCVSELGRFLFSDVLKGVYVEGEISMSPSLDSPIEPSIEISKISHNQVQELVKLLDFDPGIKDLVMGRLNKQGITSLDMIPPETYFTIVNFVNTKIEDIKKREMEIINTPAEQMELV